MSAQAVDRKPGAVNYELHHDQLECTYEIRRTETVGVFETRDAARQHMIDTKAKRELRDQPLDIDLVAALAWCRLGGSKLGRPNHEAAFSRAADLGLLAHDPIWRTTSAGDGVLIALGLLEGKPVAEFVVAHVLWASAPEGTPQFVAAFSDGLVDAWRDLYAKRRDHVEQEWRDFFALDTHPDAWEFWTTVEHIDRPEGPS